MRAGDWRGGEAEAFSSTAVNTRTGIGSTRWKGLSVARLSEIKALLGEPRFNWSDPAPWIELERELGIEFPADFHEIVNAYGSIEINGQLYLNHPAVHLLHDLGSEEISSSGARRTWRSSCPVR
jgi:hypothetical protein